MKKYHYTECGLDNVYLINGFKITKKRGNDEEIFIHDIHGLHRKIGTLLVFKQGRLNGSEIKFIRATLDLTQKRLGAFLGVDYQTVLLWEKNKIVISKTAEHLLRIIFFSYLARDADNAIYHKINEIADLDAHVAQEEKKIELKEVNKKWHLVA